jgi:capsular polysaccharide biosynthesis protein
VGVPGIGGESANKLVAVLESRTVAEDVIKTLDLITVLFEDDQDEQPTFQDAVRSLTDITEITDDKEGLISITVEYKAPRMAADIANQYTIHHRTPTIPQ